MIASRLGRRLIGRRALLCQQRRGLSEKVEKGMQEASGAPPPSTIVFEERAKSVATGSIWLGVAAVAGVSAFFIGKELVPTTMSPNQVFNSAFEHLRDHPEIVSRLGDNIKGFGGDYNRRKEGRRNFVEHDEYKDLDGVKRTRVKFNMEGSRGKAVVYAEVAENMARGEFAYIIIEQNNHGRPEAVALMDNRPHYTRGELQEKIVNKLNKAKAKLYGMSNCPWTQRQLLEVGEFSEKLNVLMCDKAENKEQCDKAESMGLKGFPTWEINGELVPSFQRLEDLQNIALQL